MCKLSDRYHRPHNFTKLSIRGARPDHVTQAENSVPHIDCVIIGVNAEKTLASCISSIRAANYPQSCLHIYYADGGSHDNSLAIAAEFTDVTILALNPEHPTPGLGRNAGWKAGKSPLVHFFDSDTILHPDWLAQAVATISEGVAAVRGNRCEIFPRATLYNWIGSLEWNDQPGDVECFGGDVLIRRSVLEQSGGYDEVLVGGEDPELSRRIRHLGWRIIQLDQEMTRHDLAMTRFGQYWQRAYRSGYAFAAVTDRFSKQKTGFWFAEFRRILVRGGGCQILLSAALVSLLLFPEAVPLALAMAISGLGLLFFPRLFRVGYFARDKQLSRSDARIYAWHCSIVVLPDLFGLLRYYWGKWFDRPLRNRRRALATGISVGKTSSSPGKNRKEAC